MKETPIIFSTDMVKAILANLKIMTRRLNGLDFINENPHQWKFVGSDEHFINSKGLLEPVFCVLFQQKDNPEKGLTIRCPYGQPGDLLWVRETWLNDSITEEEPVYIFKANNEDYPRGSSPWKPSIHMPKVAARIWLEITDIRVERLQYIIKKDAIAEGIESQDWEWGPTAFPDGTIDSSLVGMKTKSYRDYSKQHTWMLGGDPRESFRTLWDSINAKPSNQKLVTWNSNPWVWVIEFKVLSTTGKPERKEAAHA